MKKTVSIIFLSFFVLLAGVCVVYYNTGSLIYDEIYIFSYNDNSVTFLDFTVCYDDVYQAVDKMRALLPDKLMPIRPSIYNVYNYYI